MRILQMQQWMQNIQNQTLEKMVTLQLHCTRNCDLVAFCMCVSEVNQFKTMDNLTKPIFIPLLIILSVVWNTSVAHVFIQ